MIHFWIEEEKRLLKEAQSFEDLLNIALSVTSRIEKPTAQVCGPISTGGAGSRDANARRFKIAIGVLYDNGWTVFDQMIFQDKMVELSAHIKGEAYNMDILDIFYKGLFDSGNITQAVFLPGWESSFGARWERELFATLPIEIVEYPQDLFEEVLRREQVS